MHGVLCLGATLTLLLSTSLAVSDDNVWDGESHDDQVVVGSTVVSANHEPGSGATSATPPTYELMRKPLCVHAAEYPYRAITCLDSDDILSITCTDGTEATPPLWRRDQLADGSGWSQWRMLDYYRCPEDIAMATVVAREFQTLTIAPSGISIEPPNGWTLAGLDTVVFAEHANRTLRATILGQGVTIRAIAQSYAWDFGDGSAPLSTADPGRPYPNASISHVYRAAATRTIRLTTTWSGEYLVDGFTGWLPVGGTAATVSTSAPLRVHTAESRLVDGPVRP